MQRNSSGGVGINNNSGRNQMSQWTHINGCLRIDGLPMRGHNYTHVETILGKPWMFGMPLDEVIESSLPSGSEGSIQYRILEVGTGLVWLTIPIWGDLRDVGESEIEKIVSWFRSVCLHSQLWIRSGILEIDVEGATFLTICLYQPSHESEPCLQVFKVPNSVWYGKAKNR